MTLMAYVDETGDTGDASQKGASSCYALGCVLLDLDNWPSAFDTYLAFRQRLRSSFGVPVRAELKANYLIRGHGPLKNLDLAPNQRQYIYREHLRLLESLPARAFGVVTDKQKTGASGSACFDTTWEMLLQRLERTSAAEQTTLMITHDEGENDAVRKQVRKARRHLTAGSMQGGGTLNFKAHRFVDDPIPRNSQQSFFIQLADMVAYAAWRSYMPPSPGVAKVVPQQMWSQVGAATHGIVNSRKLNGSVPGVVLRTS